MNSWKILLCELWAEVCLVGPGKAGVLQHGVVSAAGLGAVLGSARSSWRWGEGSTAPHVQSLLSFSMEVLS